MPDADTSFADDIALDSSAIINDLAPDVSLEFPFTSAQPRLSFPSVHLSSPPPLLHSVDITSCSITNAVDIATPSRPDRLSLDSLMQATKAAEIQYAKSLQALLDFGVPQAEIQHFFDGSSLASCMAEICIDIPGSDSEDPVSIDANTSPTPFELQIKQKRFQSDGIW
jgi:hypothetical protein